MNLSSVRFEVKLALLVTIVMIVSMWVYYRTTENLFVWDSYYYLIGHSDRISSLSVENLWWMATSLEFSNWHPLTWFSWAIDYQLYGWLSAWGFHFSNNLWHAINSALMFGLVLTVLGLVYPVAENFAMRKDNNSLIAAFLASLLFAVHPQHVESVAWVAERKDLLCQFFLLLSLLAYVKYVTCNQLIRRRWYITTFGLFFLAALSKPMAVTFPVVLLLVDVYPLRRTSLVKPIFSSIHQKSYSSLLVEKIPFALMSLVLVLTTVMAQDTAIGSMVEFPLMARIINALHSTVFYLEKFFIPLSLSPHYTYFQIEGSESVFKALLFFSISISITAAAIFAWRKQKRAWLIAWMFYLLTLSPVLGLIQVGVQGAADRYAYFPTVPLYLLIAAGLFLMLGRGGTIGKSLLLITAMAVLFLFAVQTGNQIRVWQNESSLWTHVIKMDPNNKFAHANRGIIYKNNADYENAALEFEAAGEGGALSPDSTLAWRAVTYMHLGRNKEAIEYLIIFGTKADSNPKLVADTNCIQYNLGWNFAQLEMYQESIDLFSRIAPDSDLEPDTSAWLAALSSVKKQNDKVPLGQDLPGICENLIPSRAREQRIR